jgi:glycosyltransferase involved in cell wall biosynthesis
VVQGNEDVWIVIPVYNEEKVIAGVLENVLAIFPNVVCVDDGSSDNSAQEILGTRAHLVRHPINMGQGAALQTGLRYALARTGSQYDVVLGSRFLENPETVPWIKRVVLRTVVALSPTARRLKLTDAHNGLRVFGRGPADQLRITHNGMAHASEIATALARSPWRVVECPVTILYTDYSRAKGQSLINGINILFDVSMSRRGK